LNQSNPAAKDVTLEYPVKGMDFLAAGEASSNIKHALQLVGFSPEIIRRVAITAYESEMNIVIHAYEGVLRTVINPEKIVLTAEDTGPGIAEIELAMKEGYSTAPDHIREMGFGAGMGLPNIKNCADEFTIDSTPGKGTKLRVVIYNK